MEDANRILGGGGTGQLEYPFIALLYRSDGTYYPTPSCGGALITPNMVITAAHCQEIVKVVIGAHERLNEGEVCRESFDVVDRFAHPSYTGGTGSEFDIAIMVLSGNSSYPAATPYNPTLAGIPNLESEGVNLVVAGWGKLGQNGQYPSSLHAVKVPVADQAACHQSYSQAFFGYTDKTRTICVGAEGYDSCIGDSGGPLFRTYDGVAYIVGVVSWGWGCGRQGYPGVYARVSKFLEFVCNVSKVCITTAPTTQAPSSSPTPSPTHSSLVECVYACVSARDGECAARWEDVCWEYLPHCTHCGDLEIMKQIPNSELVAVTMNSSSLSSNLSSSLSSLTEPYPADQGECVAQCLVRGSGDWFCNSTHGTTDASCQGFSLSHCEPMCTASECERGCVRASDVWCGSYIWDSNCHSALATCAVECGDGDGDGGGATSSRRGVGGRRGRVRVG